MTTLPTIAAIRFGYGFSPGQQAPQGVEDLLARLAGPDAAITAFPIESFADGVPRVKAYERAKTAYRKDRDLKANVAALDGVLAQLETAYVANFRATVSRSVFSADGFRERLVQFWGDHFTVRAKAARDRAGPSAFVDETIRPNLTGNFADMLTAVVLHPVMLRYLDQSKSFGPNSRAAKKRGLGLNENLGREVLELHTLGVDGNYKQEDVRSFAELLTGLTFGGADAFQFNAAMAEPGAETVLGKTYGGAKPALKDITQALHDIALHPDTARHLSRKLAVHFVADAPDETLVTHIAEAYATSQGDLMACYTALLEHPAAWQALGAKAKQPFDFVVSSIRSLGMTPATFAAFDDKTLDRLLLKPLRQMGQPFQQPGGPNGWPEDIDAWVTPQGLGVRIQWAMTAPLQLVSALQDPRDFVRVALADFASPPLVLAASRAESVPEGVGVILASPEFNRR